MDRPTEGAPLGTSRNALRRKGLAKRRGPRRARFEQREMSRTLDKSIGVQGCQLHLGARASLSRPRRGAVQRPRCAPKRLPRACLRAPLCAWSRAVSNESDTHQRAVEKTHHARVRELRRANARSRHGRSPRARALAPGRRLRERRNHGRDLGAAPRQPTRARARRDRS